MPATEASVAFPTPSSTPFIPSSSSAPSTFPAALPTAAPSSPVASTPTTSFAFHLYFFPPVPSTSIIPSAPPTSTPPPTTVVPVNMTNPDWVSIAKVLRV